MSGTSRGPARVVLHIGLMKSGTTFIQQLLSHHREALCADGVLFPGSDYARQVAGVRDVIDLRGPLSGAELDGAWTALDAEVSAWTGPTAILSVEHLSLARTPHIHRIVDALTPAEVDVVITARDMARVLPSSWQETVQNALTWSWDEFVASIMGAPAAMGAPAKRFWRQHGLLDIVDRWARVIGGDRVAVVTVPPSSAPPSALWDRFCTAVGLDGGRYPLADVDRPVNASLDRDAAELLRLLNARLGDQLDQADYVRVVKRPLAKRAFAQLPSPQPITLSPEHLAWAVKHGEHVVAGLLKRDVPVVGHVRELVPSGDAAPVDPSAQAAAAERIADLATVAAHALLKELVSTARATEGRDHRPPARPVEVET